MVLTPEQVARQRSFEINHLLEIIEPLSAFGARWEIAASQRDTAMQKRLVQLALRRVVVHEDCIETVEASRTFAHLLHNTGIAISPNSIGAEEARLVAQLFVQSAL